MRSIIFIVLNIIFSSSALGFSCADIDGAWISSPKDGGTYLGFFGNQFASSSVMNEFGTYGSQFNNLSLRNSLGDFGTQFGQYGVLNSIASDPPEIYKYGTFIGYVTTNTLKTPRATLAEIDEVCNFTSATEFGVPASLVSLTASQGTYFNAIDLSISVGVGTTSVYVSICPNSFCSSQTYLGETSASSVQITGLPEQTTYYFLVSPINRRGFGGGLIVSGSTGAAPDTTAPVISLVGSATVAHALGVSYTDAGATATDNVDGTITANITTSGTVDVNTVGTYTITYSVSDAAGNAASSVTRTVTVADLDSDADGTPDSTDIDDDGDGVSDDSDAFPLNAAESVDTDGDGTGDNADIDDDNDGVLDEDDGFQFISLDGRADPDGDGFPSNCDAECLSSGMLADLDDDGDGVADVDDSFPLDNTEAIDTDGDGTGNNADLDDDNDGFSDEEELAAGTDPLSASSCPGCFNWDIDDDGEAIALTDGLMMIRHMFGFGGDSLTAGAIGGEAGRATSDAISGYLTGANTELDIDGDGESKALTDGLLLIRYLFGFSGDSLLSGAIGNGAERDTAEEVEAYIEARLPAAP